MAAATADAAVQAPAQVRVTGVLTQDAELRFTAGEAPRALLFLQVQQPSGLPYEVRQDCGCEPACLIAAKGKQRILRRGSVVTVYARGITPRIDHGHAVLKLDGVTDVVPSLSPTSWPGRALRQES